MGRQPLGGQPVGGLDVVGQQMGGQPVGRLAMGRVTVGGIRVRVDAVAARVVLLAAAHLAVTATLNGLAVDDSINAAGMAKTLALTIAFTVVGVLPVNVEHGRHAASFTLVDAVLVVGFFLVPQPWALVVAAAMGEVVACAVQRQRLIKVVFNASAAMGAVTLSARTFDLLPTPDATHPATWGVTFVALLVYLLLNHASTSAVLMVVEGRRFHDLFLESLATAVAATAVCGAIGLSFVVLYAAAPGAPLLLLPLGIVAFLAFRAVASHRSEMLRFKRLYDASSNTASLRDIASTLSTLADEARSLAGGTIAVAAAPDSRGRWYGVLVGDGFGGPLRAETTKAIVHEAAHGSLEVPLDELPAVIARLAPGAKDCVIASSTGGAEAILLVFREVNDGHGAARADVLSAFAAHAALAASNSRLFEEVEASLRRQIDLHRQKDEFLAAVSHELRTPLTGVLGAVVSLRRLGDRLDATKRERLCELAERQGIRLKRLIEDLLLVAAAESGSAAIHLEPVEIGPFLAKVRAPRENVAVVIEPGAPRAVRTDPARVTQIVDALLDNATKFAPGQVEVVAAAAVGGGCTIAVRDHGRGIAPEDRERVFDRFVQLDQSSTRSQGGTGMGLYLSRQLADLLGGVLTVEETEGGGCTFMLALPDQPERAIAPESDTSDDEGRRVVTLTSAATPEEQP